MRKIIGGALALLCLVVGPAWSQYGGPSIGGGLPGPSTSAPPPPGSIGNPPPKMKPPKYFDGAVREISGNVVTVDQKVHIPGEADQVVEMKFTLADKLLTEPVDYKPHEKDSIRVIYEPKTVDGQDVRIATKIIHEPAP